MCNFALVCIYICYIVWKELEKENKEFFETYAREREERITEMETMQRIQKMLEETAARDADNEG